jgi:hypothetical protein
MKTLFFALVLSIIATAACAQAWKDTCSFLKNLKFKNGRDTNTIKATYIDLLQAPPELIVKQRPKIYQYKIGSYLNFQPENCGLQFAIPLLAGKWVDSDNILNEHKLGAIIKLTIVVFNESFLNKNEPDCLIIKVTSARPPSTDRKTKLRNF